MSHDLDEDLSQQVSPVQAATYVNPNEIIIVSGSSGENTLQDRAAKDTAYGERLYESKWSIGAQTGEGTYWNQRA